MRVCSSLVPKRTGPIKLFGLGSIRSPEICRRLDRPATSSPTSHDLVVHPTSRAACRTEVSPRNIPASL